MIRIVSIIAFTFALTSISGCSTKNTESLKGAKPIRVVSQESLKDNPDLNMGNVLILMMSNLPIPQKGDAYQEVLSKIKESKSPIVRSNNNIIVAMSYVTDSETKKEVPFSEIEYHFNNGLFSKGPVIVKMPGDSKIKVEGTRINK